MMPSYLSVPLHNAPLNQVPQWGVKFSDALNTLPPGKEQAVLRRHKE